MATSTAPLTLEQRIQALEQQLAPLIAGQVPGKLSTRAAGFLTAVAAGVTYVIAAGVLPSKWAFVATVIVTGISAFVTAEET